MISRLLQFVIFLSVFSSIYFGLNYYVLWRFFGFFDLKRSMFFYLLAIGITLLYPLSMFLGKSFLNIFTKYFYAFAASVFGIIFLSFVVLLIYEVLKFIPGFSGFRAGFILLALIGILSVYAIANPFFVKVNEVDLGLAGLSDDVKIVQLSDVHVGSIRNSGFLRSIVTKVNDIDPDFVVITGDLVDGSAKLHEHMFDPLRNIKAPVYFIAGNHEYYEGLDEVYTLLEKIGLNILRKDKVEVNGIQLVGVEFLSSGTLAGVLENIDLNKDVPSVLLYHIPFEVEAASNHGFDLMLSGHTHNGQIIPFNFLVRTSFKYVKGLHYINGMNLYVSVGTGVWGPPMRLGSRSEITVFNLKAE